MNAEIRPIRSAAETSLAEAFASTSDSLPGSAGARRQAIDTLLQRGVPNRRVEAWKYTDLRAQMRSVAPLAGAPDAAQIELARDRLPLGELDADLLVLVNGRVVPELSRIAPLDGLTISPLASALDSGETALASPGEEDFIGLYNAAFASDGAVIRVAPGVTVERPIHVASLQVGPASASHVRIVLSLGEGARATLVDSLGGDLALHQGTTVIDLDVAANAHLTHLRLLDPGQEWITLSSLNISLGDASRLDTVVFGVGSTVLRQEVNVDVVGAKAVFDFRNAAIADGRRHVDTTLVVDHSGHGCEGRELFKTVLDGEAHAVFQGKIIVQPSAQKTDSKMMAKAMMLAEGPEADMKPELEIYADDVLCGHGATAGAIDEDLLFYLRSRGIEEAEAQALMVQAFLGEVMESVELEAVQDAMNARARVWLEGRIGR